MPLLRLSGFDDDDATDGISLLADLKWLFERERGRALSSAAIVHDLAQMEDRPWPEYSHGQPISARGVAKLLAAFGIAPKQVPVGAQRVKGYRPEQFRSAFERYVQGGRDLSDASSSNRGHTTVTEENPSSSRRKDDDDRKARKSVGRPGFDDDA